MIDYWIVRYKGTLKQLGRVDRLSEAWARAKRDKQLHPCHERILAGRPQPIHLIELIPKFHVWLEEYRPGRTAGERRKHLRKRLRDDGETWVHDLRLKGQEEILSRIPDPLYKRHYAVSIKAGAQRVAPAAVEDPEKLDPDRDEAARLAEALSPNESPAMAYSQKEDLRQSRGQAVKAAAASSCRIVSRVRGASGVGDADHAGGPPGRPGWGTTTTGSAPDR